MPLSRHPTPAPLSLPDARPSTRRPFSLATHCAIVVGLLLPTTLLAETSADSPKEPVVQVALHQAPEIRLRLHGLEDLSDDPRETPPPALSEADELKKQAQTRYLAAKLKKREATIRRYVDLAWAEASRRQRLKPELLIAIMHKESELRPKVQSPYGAQGLMQVVRRWHHDKLHASESLFDPAVNIRVGADVLEEYLASADGNLDTALRKYSGNSRGYANTVLKETRALARVAERAASRTLIAQG